MKVCSFFAGAGGLDLGFSQAGFEVIWANEYDKSIWATYRHNHPNTLLDTRSITEINSCDVPDCDGIVGGPPCQSWSAAGSLRGIDDKRGQLFFDFVRILTAKQPKFFLAENVAGMLLPRHRSALDNIKAMFRDAGYRLSFALLNAHDYGVAQDRKRVFFIGIRRDLPAHFEFPLPLSEKLTLADVIADIADIAPSCSTHNQTQPHAQLANHEYMSGGFSSIYMSRNRVRAWDEPSFTIQASGRHAPLHPQAPKMPQVSKDKRQFATGHEHLYRRLSVRECARIQGFDDDFTFIYQRINDGYKMIGNAVPVALAKALAEQIKHTLTVDGYHDGTAKRSAQSPHLTGFKLIAPD